MPKKIISFLLGVPIMFPLSYYKKETRTTRKVELSPLVNLDENFKWIKILDASAQTAK